MSGALVAPWRLTITVAIVGALGGLFGGALSGYVTGQLQTDRELRAKAADIIFADDPTPTEMHARARVLVLLFPDELEQLIGQQGQIGDPNWLFFSGNQHRMSYLEALLPTLTCPEQVHGIWRQLFGPSGAGGDTGFAEWLSNIVIPACPPGSQAPVN